VKVGINDNVSEGILDTVPVKDKVLPEAVLSSVTVRVMVTLRV
jgi:hypothetical protein